MDKKQKNKPSKYSNIILALLVILIIIVGIFVIKDSIQKADKAKSIGEKILKLYFDAKK